MGSGSHGSGTGTCMRPALVIVAAAIALFLLVKGAPYLLVRAEGLATSIVFSHAWDRARGGSFDDLADSMREQQAEGGAWHLTAARPVARLSVPRLDSDAVIVEPDRRRQPGFADFLLVAPSLTRHGGQIPPPDAVRGSDGGPASRVMPRNAASSEDMAAAAATGTVHAHGVEDAVIVDTAGRSLRFLPDLQPGDTLRLEGVDGRIYVYRVTGTRVALALNPGDKVNADLIEGRPELTLVAPYPLNDLSPSAFRYVVRADFVDLADR